MDNDTQVILGRVFEGVHLTPAPRSTPHVGDVVTILAGKHASRTGQVAGRLDYGDVRPTRWTVMRDDGVIFGQYPVEHLKIIIRRS